jgi:hypothetical protein
MFGLSDWLPTFKISLTTMIMTTITVSTITITRACNPHKVFYTYITERKGKNKNVPFLLSINHETYYNCRVLFIISIPKTQITHIYFT